MGTDVEDKTRERLKRVALELFSEKGYSGTSMREIAQRLGVTKAALYYHFPSKEDIVRTLISDYTDAIDGLVAWAAGDEHPEPAEMLTRWAELVRTQGVDVIRFVHANQHVFHELKIDKNTGFARMRGLFDAIAGPDASIELQLRARMAVSSMHMAAITAQEMGVEDDEAFAIALDVARSTLGSRRVRR